MDRSSKQLQELEGLRWYLRLAVGARAATSEGALALGGMQHDGLHAAKRGLEANPRGSASGHDKPPSSGQAPSWRDFGVR